MSRLLCDCGHIINFTVTPNEAEYSLVHDMALASVKDEDFTARTFYDAALAVLRCRQCGGLWVQWESGGEYTFYPRHDYSLEQFRKMGFRERLSKAFRLLFPGKRP